MDNLFPNLHWTNLLIIPGLLIGYTVHELGHAFIAYFLGDYSQVEKGQLTLNPFKHIAWFGFFFFVLFGIGWPKPLRADLNNLKRGYLDLFLVAVSGPLANLAFSLLGLMVTMVAIIALVYGGGAPLDDAILFLFPIKDLPQTLDLQAWTMAFTKYIFTTSLWLAIISLLPLPGLDGFVAITSLVIFFRQRRQAPADQQPLVPNTPMTLDTQRRRRNSAAEIHFKIGAEYHENQEYEDAIARYRQATRSDHNFGPAYVNMGLAYLARGERKKAIQAFRGAVQYADDKRSQESAWQQLHQLSEVSPIDKSAARESMAKMGAAPWTDTRPRPNWLSLGIGSGLLLLTGIFLYSYLLAELIEFMRR